MPSTTQKTGNFLLNLLRAASTPFRQAAGIGQEIAYGGAQKLGLADADQVERARQLAQQRAAIASLTPQERQDPLIVPKSVAGIGAYVVPAGKAIQGASALTKILAAAKMGAGAGALAGFGTSESGKELGGTLGGATIGGLTAGALRGISGGASKLLGGKTKSPTITGAKLKADPFFEKTKQEMTGLADEIGITDRMSSTQKVKTVQNSFENFQKTINNSLKETAPVKQETIQGAFETNFKNSNIQNETPSVKRMLDAALKKLSDATGDNVKLNQLKTYAKNEMGNFFRKGGEQPTQKQEVWGTVYNTVKDSLDTISPEIRAVNNKQRVLFDLADEFVPVAKKAADKIGIKAPFFGEIGQLPITREGTGRAVSAVGRAAVSPVTAPAKLATRAMAAIPPQLQQILSTAGVTSMGQGEQPQEQPQLDQMTQQPEAETIQPDRQKAMSIIDQMEAQATGGQTGGPSKEQLGQAYVAALMSGNTKAATQLKAMISFQESQAPTTGKQLPAGEVAKLNETKTAISLLPKLQESFKESAGVFGPVAGGVRSLNPYDAKAKKAQATIFLVRQIIGKGLEGGVLRKEDEYKYKEILPKLTDTPETVQNKINLLNETLNQKFQTSTQGFQTAGYDPFGGGVPATEQEQILQALQSQGLSL